MQKTLTAKFVENLQPRVDRRYEVRDVLLPGFGIRVSVNGKKTWFAVARIDGRQVRHTIGKYPTVTLAEAREAARLILKDIQLGLYAPAKPIPWWRLRLLVIRLPCSSRFTPNQKIEVGRPFRPPSKSFQHSMIGR